MTDPSHRHGYDPEPLANVYRMTVNRALDLADAHDFVRARFWKDGHVEREFDEVDDENALLALAAEVRRLSVYAEALWHRPNLGSLTTRDLLEELVRRGQAEEYYVDEADMLVIGAASCIDALPGSMLDYRTEGS